MQGNYNVNHFAQIPSANIPRSRFAMPHSLKTTVESGELVPIFVQEVLPGDTHSIDCTTFGRLATPITPFMDDVVQEVFFFFVPNRLVWDNWEKFCGERKNPGDSIDYLIPQVRTTDAKGNNLAKVGTLWDYLGLPVVGSTKEITPTSVLYADALAFRAYNLIYNEWFRDENLQESVEVPLGDDVSDLSIFPIRRRGKRHDYFSASLPWPQKGPGVELPLGTVAPLSLYNTTGTSASLDGVGSKFMDYINGTYQASNLIYARGFQEGATAGATENFSMAGAWGNTKVLGVDLTDVTAVTINSLREAFQIQGLLERDAVGGTRYSEILRAHFGCISPDARLQRPEFLGGFSQPVIVNPVVQNSSTNDTTPQGNLAGYGVVGSSRHGFTKSFVEHGVIIGLVNFRADLSYQQGINRMWSRRTRYDFFWPALAHLGEQAVLNKEIYTQGSSANNPDDFYNEETDNNDVFGYQERYAEYRYKQSMITGKMRSYNGESDWTAEEGKFESLDYWHLAQNFENLPRLNSEFIEENPPLDRVIAVPSEPQFLLDCHFKLVSVRPIPVYATPALLSRF